MGAGILSPALFVMQEIPLCDISENHDKKTLRRGTHG